MTPIFSYLFFCLLFRVSTRRQNALITSSYIIFNHPGQCDDTLTTVQLQCKPPAAALTDNLDAILGGRLHTVASQGTEGKWPPVMYQLDEKPSSARLPPFQRTATKLGAENSKFGVIGSTLCILHTNLSHPVMSLLYIWVMHAIFEIQQN